MRPPRAERVVLAVLMLFLAAEIFSGVLRYGFAQAGAPWLIYVPKLLIMATVLSILLSALYRGRVQASLAAVLAVVIVFGFVGMYFTQNILQAAFGIFVLFPLVIGFIAEPALSRLERRLLPYATMLWLCAAAGVVYDFFVETPWFGFAYELGETELTSSRQWWTFGIERISGFSRASYEVASHLLFLAIPVIVLGRGWFLKSVIWIATGVLIVLTTTKKTAGVYVLLTLLIPFFNLQIGRLSLGKAITAGLPWVVVGVGVALPISTLFIDYALDLESNVSLFLLASFEDRLTWMWPDGLDLVAQHGSLIFGRGIGGIGVAQSYFESDLYNAADNLYLYLYAAFGLTALPIVIYYTTCVARLESGRSPWERTVWFWALAILMNGWAGNGVESSYSSILLGITFAYARRRRLERRSGRRDHADRQLLQGNRRQLVDRRACSAT